MGHSVLIVLTVIGVLFFIFALLIYLIDFMDKTGLPFPRPRLDFWTFVFGLTAIIGFVGLAYVIWRARR